MASLENKLKLQPTIWGLLLVLGTGFATSGCGGSGSGNTPVQPTITATTPASGATFVSTNSGNPGTSVITATFSQPMNPDSFTSQTFTADATSPTGQLAGVVTYSNQTATLTLNSALPPNTVVNVKISGFTANSARGNASVGLAYKWSFTTAANAPATAAVSTHP